MQTSNKEIEIKYTGALNEIGVEVFVESLTNYALVAQETSSILIDQSKLNINIKALEKGSFIVALDLIVENSPNLFSKENVEYAAAVVGVVSGMYGFIKWISKNGKIDKVEKIEKDNLKITNKKGSIVINQEIYNIYRTNPKIRKSIRNTFNKLKDDNNITGFEILEKNNDHSYTSVFSVDKEDFNLMASEIDTIDEKKQSLLINNQELSVFKVVFSENYKWEFFYKGNKIFADIDDTDFYLKIEKGEIAFRSGDRLIVDLEIKQVFNEKANIFENKSYHILKVIRHIPRKHESSHIQFN